MYILKLIPPFFFNVATRILKITCMAHVIFPLLSAGLVSKTLI